MLEKNNLTHLIVPSRVFEYVLIHVWMGSLVHNFCMTIPHSPLRAVKTSQPCITILQCQVYPFIRRFGAVPISDPHRGVTILAPD